MERENDTFHELVDLWELYYWLGRKSCIVMDHCYHVQILL